MPWLDKNKIGRGRCTDRSLLVKQAVRREEKTEKKTEKKREKEKEEREK